MDPDKLSIEELADGLALWEEYRPQTAQDWIGVARRTLADGEDGSKGSATFHALCLAVQTADEMASKLSEKHD